MRKMLFVGGSPMYEAYCLLLHGKNLRLLCLKYQNLQIFTEKNHGGSLGTSRYRQYKIKAEGVSTYQPTYVFYIKKVILEQRNLQ